MIVGHLHHWVQGTTDDCYPLELVELVLVEFPLESWLNLIEQNLYSHFHSNQFPLLFQNEELRELSIFYFFKNLDVIKNNRESIQADFIQQSSDSMMIYEMQRMEKMTMEE